MTLGDVDVTARLAEACVFLVVCFRCFRNRAGRIDACMQAVQGAIQAMEAELGELRLMVKDVTLRSFSEDSSRQSNLSEVRKRAGWKISTHRTYV